ncbi:MAG: hypothetical protein NTW30_04435 [Candidatus Aenigmarchaeota archaeon]|nr:hypothetical protein [Candidatus Aenigmarchaeota archaeon]
MISAHLLETFSDCYIASFEIGVYRIEISDGNEFKKNRLLSNSFDALLYFTQYAHERQGANSNFSRYHRIALRKSLNERIFNDVLLQDNKFPENVWNEFKNLTKDRITGIEYPNESHTIGAIRDILIHLKKNKESNIILLLKQYSLEDASNFLMELKGIGEKISALFLRDLQEYFNFWEPNKSNYFLIQPVDRWVKRLSKECWSDFIPSDIHDNNAKQITELCYQDNVNPIHFNMGAWFIGSHYEELCRFHNIPEEQTNNLEHCIKEFNRDKIIRALKKYLSDFKDGNTFYF